jgi:hypothetical protein
MKCKWLILIMIVVSQSACIPLIASMIMKSALPLTDGSQVTPFESLPVNLVAPRASEDPENFYGIFPVK